jgi:hypothetical protein
MSLGSGFCEQARRIQFREIPAVLELVFTVCSILHGANCHEEPPIRLDENAQMIACVMASQIEGARWVDSHPNFYVVRATCQPSGKFAKT